MENFQKEISYFLNRKPELCAKYPNKYVVIRNKAVVGNYESYTEAFSKSLAKYNRFDFYVALCVPQSGITATAKTQSGHLSKRVPA